MTSVEPDALLCPQCGNSNYGAGLTCMFCDAPLSVRRDASAKAAATPPTGTGFQWTPTPANREVIRPAPATVTAERYSPATLFCTDCGTQINPGAQFCRKCGRKQQQEAASAVVSQRAASKGQRALKGTVSVFLTVGSIVATYFLANRVFGPMLGERFGDATQTIVVVGVSMAVGSIARRIAK